MSFPFEEICTLLSRLEDVENRDPPLLPRDKPERYKEVINSWFKSHRNAINALDVEGATAFLSTLLPEWRNDRVYGIQAPSLCKLLGRVLKLSASRSGTLKAYTQPGYGDLGTCTERAIKAGGSKGDPPLQVEDVDNMLQTLAGRCHFSDPSVPRLPSSSSEMRERTLSAVFHRATPNEGKWLVRLLLKDFRPVRINDSLILRNFHFLLPDLLRFQHDFCAALTILRRDLSEYHFNPDLRSQAMFKEAAAKKFRPVVGTKVSRPNFHKAWGIDHCMKMVGGRSWVVERKYDGEYCEVHVDLTRSEDPAQCIKIFSKSGKDSTQDRKGIHSTLIEALRLGKKDCKIQKQAIFLGELVVFSDDEDRIMPFEELRKYVTRSGVSIGTDQDSQPRPGCHLAIVFFDLLLLDDEIVMNKPVEERRNPWLKEVYKKRHGRAMSAEWVIVDFSDPSRAKRTLVQQFGASIARRNEGLVLKPCGVPYFSLEHHPNDYRHSYIKVKKDYVNELGDEEDFAVIGASFNAQQAATAPAKAFIKWTTFHLGCLVNKEDVDRKNARPIYKHVGAIDQEKCIPNAVLERANMLGNLSQQPFDASEAPRKFDIENSRQLKMDVVFDKPLVFEVLGSGYQKPSNCNHLMLRHARVKKLHEDRTWKDCISFDELQAKGREVRELPDRAESQETRSWVERIERTCMKKFEIEKLNSPRSSRGTATPDRSKLESGSPVVGHVSSERRHTSELPRPLHSPKKRTPKVANTPSHGSLHPETRETPSKRHCEEEDSSTCSSARTKRPCLDSERRRTSVYSPRAQTSPLSEITNIANLVPHQQQSHMTRLRSRALSDLTTNLTSLVRPSKDSESQEQHSQAALEASRAKCEASTKCPFTNVTVHLAPCIAQTPYITDNLLSSHNTTTVSTLSHWNRDSFAHAPLTSIISESQSHQGMRKIVLVESKRRQKVRELVGAIRELNGGRFRERIEVWDWRVLEECGGHDRGVERLKTGFFIGATMFDDHRKRSLFVGEREWVRV